MAVRIVDLPQLQSIQLGYHALQGDNDNQSDKYKNTLRMRGAFA